jgi:Ni/Fe-hydrogenase subunit HybB-like protein
MSEHSTSSGRFGEGVLPVAATHVGYANTPVTKVPSWHGIIAWDVLLNGMATGLFMAAAITELTVPAVFTAVAKVAYPVALVFLLVDLVLLVLDLGDSSRFHHMLRVFKPGSPMSLGTWCLTIFSLPLTAAAGLSMLSEIGVDFKWARLVAVVVGLLPAFGSAAYKGVLLSTNSQPGWKDARSLGAYLSNSALLVGCGELLLVSSIMQRAQAVDILRSAFVLLLILNVIPLIMLFANLRPAHALLYTHGQQWRAGILIFVSGLLIPLSLTLLGSGLVFILCAVISLLFESWFVRFVFVKIPHTSPLKIASLEAAA